MAELFVVLTLLVWWKHRENIRRLLAGTESRIGQKIGKSDAARRPDATSSGSTGCA